ncbi:MAG: cytochrome P450, partial [Chloroflexota bacterium]|nr:cytochrome P450 [Chloroflexota bacterium]
MSTGVAAAPFEAIPTVPISGDYGRESPRWLARMAEEHGPIFRVIWGPSFPWHPIYLVGPEANRFVLHTGREHFSHDLGWTPIIGGHFGKGILNMDGAEHARHRKLMNPAFTIAYMARYLPIMNRIIAERTRGWVDQGEVDLYEETRRITFDVAAEALAGLRIGPEVDRLRELFFGLLYTDPGRFPPLGGIWSLREELHGILLRRIAERRRAPTDDLLGILVTARDEWGRPLSDEQLLAHLDILLVAGHETSTTMSAWLLYLLAIHPAYLARAHAELDAVKAMRVLGRALDETGRLHPPVGNGPRGVVKDFEFAGYRVPAGTRLRYSIAGGHWLPSVFAAPERWDPDRFAPPREEDKRTPYALIPFGGGPRICIGVNFAQVEIKALAAHVLRHYTLEPVAGQDPAQLYGPTIGAPYGGIRV